MKHRTRLAALVAALALPALASPLSGCASHPEIPDDLAWGETAAEESAPLGGEALEMMTHEMERSQNDMLHFHTTLRALRARKDRSGFIQLSGFLDAYMGLHVRPLLRSEWQSNHPELMALDANLRFAVAEVFIQLRDPSRAQRTIEEIERRFKGRENMLVEYPIGGQSTLGEALELARNKKWRG